MSSDSSLKGSFISFVVIGLIGLLIKYVFGGDGNRTKLHEMFFDVLDVFLWIFLYILIPLYIIGLIVSIFQKNKSKEDQEQKTYSTQMKRNVFEENKSKNDNDDS